MKLISPHDVSDATLTYSNVPEDDAPEWAIGTTYAKDAEVILLTTHKVYRSNIAGNVGNDPSIDDGTKWIELGSTNRWKAFDQKVSDLAIQLDSIIYEFTPDRLVSGIGLINVGAASVTIEVMNSDRDRIQIFEMERFEATAIVDYYTFFTTDLSLEDVSDSIFDGLQGYPGNIIRVTLSATNDSSYAAVGQIVIGTQRNLGWSTSGTTIGFKDFSSKEYDDFGNAIIVERAFASTSTFQFAIRTSDARVVRAALAAQRAKPALYYVATTKAELGTQVYGFFRDFEIPLQAGGTSYGSLKVEGLI